MIKNKRKAFTTSEVLFTLLILGVIASFTIIVLKQDTSGREIVLKVKKAYSVVANAYEQALVEEDTYNWSSMSSDAFAQKIGEKVFMAESCGSATNLQKGNRCFPDCPKIYKAGGGSLDVCTSSEVSKFMSSDGFAYAIQIEDPVCSIDVTAMNPNGSENMRQVCGTFLLDIDSSKGARNKNFYGRDLFLFYVTRESIIPTGLDIDAKYPYKDGECKQKVYKDEFGCSALMVYGDNKLEQ